MTVTVGAIGYESKAASVALVLGGELTFNTAPEVEWVNTGTSDPCAFTAGVANTCDPGATPPAADDSDTPVAVTASHQAMGQDSDGNEKENVCTLSGSTLSRGSAAIGGDTCIVTTVFSADGYVPVVTEAVEIIVANGTLAFTSATKPAYVGILPPGESLEPSGSNFVDDNSVPVSWGSYRVNENSCTIDEDTGEITADSAASAGETCTVFASATAAGYNDGDETQIQALQVTAPGTLGTPTGPVYREELTVGGYTVPVATLPKLTPALNDREVTWTYAATGKRSGTATDDICSVDEATGSVELGSAAQAADTCEIVATAMARGYSDKAAAATILTVKGVFNSLAWSAFPNAAVVGRTINLSGNGNRPVSDPAADSYTESYVSGDCTYSNAKVLSFTDVTPCIMRVTAVKAGYANLTGIFERHSRPGEPLPSPVTTGEVTPPSPTGPAEWRRRTSPSRLRMPLGRIPP